MMTNCPLEAMFTAAVIWTVHPQSTEADIGDPSKRQDQDGVPYLFQRPNQWYLRLMPVAEPSAEDEHATGLTSDDPTQDVAIPRG